MYILKSSISCLLYTSYAKDPDETVNVAANSDYADALQQMKRFWEEYKKTRIVRNEK